MEGQEINKLIEYFLNEKRKGMAFSEIRKILEENNVEENKINIIIHNVDKLILREAIVKNQNQRAKEFIYVGLFVTIAGLIITVGTFTGIINMGNSFVLAYGPVLGGLGILFTGLGKYRR